MCCPPDNADVKEHWDMRFLAHLIKSAAPVANYLAVVALALLVLKILVLNRWSSPSTTIYELGVLCEGVLASTVASYIFYLLVVHLEKVNDRAVVSPYIDRHTSRVVGACEHQIGDIARAAGCSLSLETLTEQELTAAFSKIAPYSAAPLVMGAIGNNANWLQYFDFQKSRTRESIARVFSQLIYLDPRRVSLLAAIDDCSHFSSVGHFLHIQIRNTDLANFASAFFSYCEACRWLKKYMATNEGARTL